MKHTEMVFLAQIAVGTFSVDSEGRIWRMRRMAGGSRMGSPAYSKPLPVPRRAERSTSGKGGYLKVMFTVGAERFAVYAHRIVWMVANQSDIPDALEVNHKSGVKRENRPENLELVTRAENVKHALEVLKVGRARGERNWASKLTAAQVLEIRSLWAARIVTHKQLAAHYGVTPETISKICLRLTWKHLP